MSMAPIRAPAHQLPARYIAVLSLIALLPFGSGLLMLDPNDAVILGLANITILLLAPTMLIAWPEIRADLRPRGRLASLTMLLLAYGLALAAIRAPHMGFSLLTFAMWPALMIAGRGLQQAIRHHGPHVAEVAMIILLLAGPLYILLLPLMQAFYPGQIHWSFDMPAFNHVRRMGHLLTVSAAAGVGLVAMGRVSRGPVIHRLALGALAILALALAIWTGARGIWLSLPAGSALALITARLARYKVHWGATLALLPPAIGLACLLPTLGRHFGVLSEIQNTLSRTDSIGSMSSGRLILWEHTLELISQEPLTGYGWGQFLLLQNRFSVPQAHNLPLEILLGVGVPMGVLALGLILIFWVKAHRNIIHTGPWAVPALCVLDTMLIYSLLSGTFFYSVGAVLTGLAWGICLSSPKPDNPASDSGLGT